MLGSIRDGLSGLPRAVKRLLLIGFDILALLGVLWFSFTVRLGVFSPSIAHILLIVLAPLLAIPVFVRMGLYRAVIRYLPERAIWTMIQAMALATLGWVAALFLAGGSILLKGREAQAEAFVERAIGRVRGRIRPGRRAEHVPVESVPSFAVPIQSSETTRLHD